MKNDNDEFSFIPLPDTVDEINEPLNVFNPNNALNEFNKSQLLLNTPNNIKLISKISQRYFQANPQPTFFYIRAPLSRPPLLSSSKTKVTSI
jgi:hypothetical protein